MPGRAAGITTLCPILLLAGCGVDSGMGVACTLDARPALQVMVLDSTTSQRVCDAQVVAGEGVFTETLLVLGDAATCAYSGPYERAGVYEVRAEHRNYRPATASGVRVTADRCHVRTVAVTLRLER